MYKAYRKMGTIYVKVKILYSLKFQGVTLSPKLKTGYRYENQLWKPDFKNDATQFCGYFVMIYFLINFFIFSIILNLFKIYTNVKTPKKKLESFVQRYSFKFRALYHIVVLYIISEWNMFSVPLALGMPNICASPLRCLRFCIKFIRFIFALLEESLSFADMFTFALTVIFAVN